MKEILCEIGLRFVREFISELRFDDNSNIGEFFMQYNLHIFRHPIGPRGFEALFSHLCVKFLRELKRLKKRVNQQGQSQYHFS